MPETFPLSELPPRRLQVGPEIIPFGTVSRRAVSRRGRRPLLGELNRRLSMQAPLVSPLPENFRHPKGIKRWTYNLSGEACQRLIIYLRSDVGCQFGVRTGGCAGCRHWRLGTAGRRVPLEDMYLKQYRAAIDSGGYAPVVCIYNEGNMLNEWELPQRQLAAIVRDLDARGVRRVVLESRPEYIRDDTLQRLRAAAGRMEIEMGIGLESAHDFIRNELFLKAMTKDSYEKAVRRLRRHGIRSLTYVVLKPAFLNEAQAIADALRTLRYAFDVGSDAASVEPIGVDPHTVTALLAAAGHFQPARLWSLREVARRAAAWGEIRLGGFQFEPLPEQLPGNCPSCTPRVLAAMGRYNATYDLTALEELDCKRCYPLYLKEIRALPAAVDRTALESRLARFVAGEWKTALSVPPGTARLRAAA